MGVQRKHRTLGFTVNELLESKRFRIAVDNFKNDSMFMRAILTELGLECLTVAKNRTIKTYNVNSSLSQFELAPLMRNLNVDDFDTFNLYFSLSDAEQALYTGDIKGNLSEDERKVLFEKVKAQFMK